MSKKRIFAEPMRSLSSVGIGVNYAAIGVATEEPSFLLIINNYTDAQLTFSLDGSNDHFELGAGNSLTIDITTNRPYSNDIMLEAGTIVYVKQSGIATTGDVFVSTVYGG